MTRLLSRLARPISAAIGLGFGLVILGAAPAAAGAPRHKAKTHHDADDDGGGGGGADRTGEKVHVVAAGQTLAKIAKRYKVSVADLREANDLAPGVRLKVGSHLVIPTDDGGSKRAKTRSSTRDKGGDRDSDDDRDRDREDDSDDRGSRHKGKTSSRDRDDDRDEAPAKGRHGRAGKAERDEKEGKGYLHLVHGSESWEGKLFDKRGKVSARAQDAFSRMLRASTGKKHAIQSRLMSLVADVSEHFNGRTIEVVSGFRPFTTTQYTAHSRHNSGSAMDFHIRGISNEELRDYCKTLHNVGVGYYPNSSFVHLDVRDASATWVDMAGPGEAPRYKHPGDDATDSERDSADGSHADADEKPAARSAEKAADKPADKPASLPSPAKADPLDGSKATQADAPAKP
jgi:uncharacterized protein YcbK (DUF882 family)